MESLKSDLRVKQEKEHSLMLDLEKLHREVTSRKNICDPANEFLGIVIQHILCVQIKSQAAKQIALVEPELKQQAQHINRRKVLLTSALEKLKADMQKGAESAKKLLLAKRKTQQMKQTLKEIRYDLQQECMKVRQLEEKEKDTEQKLEYVLEDEEMDPEEILENKNRHEEQQMHKLELIGEIERMRVVMEGLKLRRKEMERSRARKGIRYPLSMDSVIKNLLVNPKFSPPIELVVPLLPLACIDSRYRYSHSNSHPYGCRVSTQENAIVLES
eukprot:1394974-Amorphochlora_amoeboformis.AAC.1